MTDILSIILAFAIIVSFLVFFLILIKFKFKKNSTKSYLDILDNKSSTTKQKASAFCSLIDVNYVCVMVKTNNGGKYDDEKHACRFEKSITTDRIQRLNALVNKINSERICHEHA